MNYGSTCCDFPVIRAASHVSIFRTLHKRLVTASWRKCCIFWLTSCAGWVWHWSLRTNQWRRKSPWYRLMIPLPPEPPLCHPRCWAPNLLDLVTTEGFCRVCRLASGIALTLCGWAAASVLTLTKDGDEVRLCCTEMSNCDCKMRPFIRISTGLGQLWD